MDGKVINPVNTDGSLIDPQDFLRIYQGQEIEEVVVRPPTTNIKEEDKKDRNENR
ncbi:hypothetical protein [Sphingobacterium olei]|uniref:hypothetical protein n=1 Tax=Sphingobacterium olei TaxID=2571155 RepID=UPI0013905231|nr:hypothetical protein [Sphingobacterium olei]